MRKRTKKLSNQEYGGYIFDLQEAIQKQVCKDETRWAKLPNSEPILPKYEPNYAKVPLSVGMWNLVRQFTP